MLHICISAGTNSILIPSNSPLLPLTLFYSSSCRTPGTSCVCRCTPTASSAPSSRICLPTTSLRSFHLQVPIEILKLKLHSQEIIITSHRVEEVLPQPPIIHLRRFRQFAPPVHTLELRVHPVHFLRGEEVALVPDALELRWTECVHSLDPGPIIAPLSTVCLCSRLLAMRSILLFALNR